MSGRTRARRRKLAAHDRGQNRHSKGLSSMLKANRAAVERGGLSLKRRKVRTLDGVTGVVQPRTEWMVDLDLIPVKWENDTYVCMMRPEELA